MRLIATFALSLCACADPPPPDQTWQLGDGTSVMLATNPLSLSLVKDGARVEAPLFIEVGIVNPIEPRRFYDPARPLAVEFRVARRAVAYRAKTGELDVALDGGGTATLTITAGDRLSLSLDASKVSGAVHTRYVWPLADDDTVYGLGELFDTPSSRGLVRPIQLMVDAEMESGTNETHVPVPLAILPARKLGLYADEVRPGAFDVGAARTNAMLVTFATKKLSVHVLVGDAFSVLDQFTASTGRPLVPPEWAFAPMQWRNEHKNREEVLADAHALRDNGIPTGTLWIDNPWSTAYNNFVFDEMRFVDPPGLIAELRRLGFRTLLWSTPYVDTMGPTAEDFAEGTSAGYFVNDAMGRPFEWPWSYGPGALVDFTAPGATEWWQTRIRRVTTIGISGFKLDFAEDLVPSLGGVSTPFRLVGGGTDVMHNIYAIGYHAAYLDTLPKGDGFLITRAGAIGAQQTTTCIWPGDLDNDLSRREGSNVGGLPAAIAGDVSLGASGYPFYGSDIGGFRNGVPSNETLVRWAEYAALGTIMQLGGGGKSHNPWDPALFTADTLAIYKRYAQLHIDLAPYLYTLAKIAGKSGAPIVRAPGLIYPGHPYEDDFLVGEGLFVAPVVVAGAVSRTVTLPPGEWVDEETGTRTVGGVKVTVDAPLDRLPRWRRVGKIVVMHDARLDTLGGAPTPGVATIEDPMLARGLRAIVTPSTVEAASFEVHDGSHVEVGVTASGLKLSAAAGTRYRDFVFVIDWKNGPTPAKQPMVATLPGADAASLRLCAGGCWYYDAGWLYVRVVEAGVGASVDVSAQ